MRKIRCFLKLIRYQNLLLLAITQFFVKNYILDFPKYIDSSASSIEFYLLVIITSLITAGGYIINDIFDIESDKINRNKNLIIGKHISTSTAIFWYYLINILAIIASIYLVYLIQNYLLIIIFPLTIYILWQYSKKYQHSFIVGNIIVSFLTSLSILNILLFSNNFNLSIKKIGLNCLNSTNFNLLMTYAAFIFFIILLREIIKDLEDLEGDKIKKSNNIASSLSLTVVKNICITINILMLILVFVSIYLIYTYINFHSNFQNMFIQIAISGFYICFYILMCYPIFLLIKSTTKQDFKRLSFIYKFIMILGSLSIPISYYFTYYC